MLFIIIPDFAAGLNEGGDIDQSKAVFSNLTDVVVEGKG